MKRLWEGEVVVVSPKPGEKRMLAKNVRRPSVRELEAVLRGFTEGMADYLASRPARLPDEVWGHLAAPVLDGRFPPSDAVKVWSTILRFAPDASTRDALLRWRWRERSAWRLSREDQELVRELDRSEKPPAGLRAFLALSAIRREWGVLPWGSQIHVCVKQTLKLLGDDDKRLIIDVWAQGAGDDGPGRWRRAQMALARCAEHAVAEVGRRLGFDPLDVSILQVQRPEDSRWRTHDLELEGRGPVDVKHVRRRNDGFVPAHTVPALKTDGSGEDVEIAGVVSPFLSHEVLLGLWRDLSSDNPMHQFLGFTSRTRLLDLHRILFDTDLSVTVPGVRRDWRYLPPWVYATDWGLAPGVHQVAVDWLSTSGAGAQHASAGGSLAQMAIDALRMYAVARAEPPDALVESTNIVGKIVVSLARGCGPLTLPDLYVCILAHGLESALAGR